MPSSCYFQSNFIEIHWIYFFFLFFAKRRSVIILKGSCWSVKARQKQIMKER
ncbi:hypothetical protein BDF20DRAFT_845375 [Mycotypha africana]|uniref:uncharacterized protein n=1 Tax=Mycotypha africana TaxID=64632 RepID=UPI002300FADA|nr:uncharacterized protein BDF20DRAFT_845375 [Mycotypha africana]KAI8991584.1 hypothetical protein BDF20DRAFT_845375 [Mycotypha africana]